jgi:hypothetical protein
MATVFTEDQLIAALRRTWEVIANDVAATGGKLTAVGAAEVCADYVYMYGGEAESKAIMTLTDKEFKRIAKLADLSL